MTTKDKVARRKLSLLELPKDLENVSRACRVMGYSRQQFYEIRRKFQTYGAEGLIGRLPGARGPHPNRVPSEIETAILDHALEHPCHSALRVEHELRLKGLQVSSGGVRGVWQRHARLTKHERLHRTLLDGHFRVEGRCTWFETIEEMQGELDEYLVVYNRKRPHPLAGLPGWIAPEGQTRHHRKGAETESRLDHPRARARQRGGTVRRLPYLYKPPLQAPTSCQ